MPKPEPIPNAQSVENGEGVGARGRRAKVVIVTPAHASYADVRVFQKEARTLADHGYDVTLFAQAPDREAPFAEDGVRIVPLCYPTRAQMIGGLPKLFWRLLKEKADLYHLHNPFSIPLTLALKLWRRKVIYDVHEDYIQRIRIREWLPKIVRAPVAHSVGLAESLIGRLADGAIATQPEVVERLGARAILLENAPIVNDALIDRSEAFAREIGAEVANPGGAFRLLYAGSLSRVRGLGTMMEALSIVNESMPARLWLIGPSDDKAGIAEARRHRAWPFVDFIGKLEYQHEVFGYMLRANVGLALFRDSGGYARISSNKLYEYMASGIPFVASAFPAWKDKLMNSGAGTFCDPSDAECVARNIVDLARNPDTASRMAMSGKRFVQAEFNWDNEGQKLLDLYEKLLYST